MSGIEIFKPMPLYVSENAAAKVKSLVEEEGNPDLKLRVFVTGGGCSGFQYGFSLDKETTDEDQIFFHEGAELVVDTMSLQYLEGSEIDFEDKLMESSFKVNNPNAASSCGCGTSFSPKS